jgi:hypothetical protein
MSTLTIADDQVTFYLEQSQLTYQNPAFEIMHANSLWSWVCRVGIYNKTVAFDGFDGFDLHIQVLLIV